MRYPYRNVVRDTAGNVTINATVNVYLSGTSTQATIYTVSVGGSPVSSVTTGTDGSFVFYVDSSSYSSSQRFRIVISINGVVSSSPIDDIVILPIINSENYTSITSATTIDPGSANSIYFLDCSTGNQIFSIVNISTVPIAKEVTLLKDGTANTATVTNSDGSLFNDDSTLTFTAPYEKVRISSNGTKWLIVGS